MSLRYGVVSDIHANLPALQAARAVLDGEGVDAYLCAGDLVGYGPHPNECVEVIADLRAVCVAGNHELMLLGRLPLHRSTRLVRQTLAWTQQVLRNDVRDYLARLPLLADAPGGVVVTHASLNDPQRYITRPADAAQQLDRLAVVRPAANVLVLGHTHRQWAYDRSVGTLAAAADGTVDLGASRRCLLNPGSVGQSRTREDAPRVRCLLLDLGRRRATFYVLPYDVERCRQDLRMHALPAGTYHLPPARVPGPLRRLRRVLARGFGLG